MISRKNLLLFSHVIIWTILALIFISSLLFFAFLLPPVQVKVKKIIESALDSALTGTVSIGSIKVFPFTNATVLNIKIFNADTRASQDTFTIQKATISFWLPSLLFKTLTIKSINAQDIFGTILVLPEKINTLPFIPASISQQNSKKKSDWNLIINSVQINNLNITYTDSIHDFSTSIRNSNIAILFPRFDSIVVDFVIPDGHLNSPWWSGIVDTLHSHFYFSSNRFFIDSLLLNGTGTSIKAHGTIPISDTANWDAVVSIHSSLRSISILQQVPGLGDNGTVNVEFILQGTILKPQWKFMSIAENISPYSIPLRSVSIKGHLLDSLIQTSTRFLSSDLSATVVFNATVESLLTVHSLNRYIATIQIDTLSSTILKKLNLSLRKFPSGYFSAYSEIHGSSIQWPDSIKTNLTFHSNKLVYPLSATIKMHSHSWNSSIKWGKNRISGKGILLNNGEIYGTILSQFSDPSLISHLFINQIITGALSVSSKLSGSLNNLSMVSRFSNGRLQWKSIQFTILNGGINLSKSGILFSDIDFSAEGPVHDALRYLNIDSVDGYLNSKIKVSGSLTKPVINVALNVSDLSYKKLKNVAVSGDILFTGLDSIFYQNLAIKKEAYLIKCFGGIQRKKLTYTNTAFDLFHDGVSSGTIFLQGEFSANSIRLAYNTKNVDIGILKAWVYNTSEIQGRIDAEGKISGLIRNPRIETEFKLVKPVYENYSLQTLDGNISLNDSLLEINSNLILSDSISKIIISGKLPLSPSSGWNIDTSQQNRKAYVQLKSETFDLAGLRSLFPMLISAQGPGALTITATNSSGSWLLDGNFSADTCFINYLPLHISASKVVIRSLISGTLFKPEIIFTAKTNDIKLQTSTVTSSFWKGSYHQDTISLDTGFARFENGGFLQVKGDITISSIDSLLSNKGPVLQFKLSKVPLNIIEQFLPGFKVQSGTVEGNLDLTLINGRFFSNGTLHLYNGIFLSDYLNKSLGPINGELVLHEDSLLFKHLTGKVGDGRVSVTGFSVLRPGGKMDINLKISGKNTSFVITDLIDANFESVNLSFISTGSGYLLDGTVRLGDTRVIRDIRITNFVKPDEITPAGSREQNPFLQSLKLKIKIELQENLFIDMNLGNMQLDGQVALSGTASNPGVTGEINIMEGYIYYLDRQFIISKGIVNNYDPYQVIPAINLDATSDVTAFAAGTAQTITYTINLSINGNLKNPIVTLTSSPPLSEPDIISVLTLGTTLGAVGSDLASRIGSLVGQEIIGFGTRKLERILNLQSITVSGNVFNSSTASGPQITLTKRFTNRLTVSYTSMIENVYRQKIAAILRLFPFLFVIGETDEFGNANINLNFRTNR